MVVDVAGVYSQDILSKGSVVEPGQTQGICHLHHCSVGYLIGYLGGQQRQGRLRLQEGKGLVGQQRSDGAWEPAKVEQCVAEGEIT